MHKEGMGMKTDMLGEILEVGNWVAVNGTQALKIMKVCKLTKKMIVVEYYTRKRKTRKTVHLYANDVIKLNSEAVFKMALTA